MVTADVVFGQTIVAQERHLIWWRWRRVGWTAVVVVHLGLSPLVQWVIHTWEGNIDAAFGFLLAQYFLLGLWVALGGLRVLVRWGAVAAALMAVNTSFIRSNLDIAPEEFGMNMLFAGLAGAGFVTGVTVCLLPLRGLVGWQIGFNPPAAKDSSMRRGQLSFLQIGAYTSAVAGMMAVVRMMADASGENSASQVIGLLGAVAIVCASGMLPAYMVLARKRIWVALVACVCWTAIVAKAHFWLAEVYPDFQFVSSTSVGPNWVDPGLALFHGSIVLTTLVTLGILRLSGLALFSSVHPNPVT